MDISIDIETLGTRPGSVILSVGAVAFDRTEGLIGQSYYSAINLNDSLGAGMAIDGPTLLWWLDQEDAARREAFAGHQALTDVLFALRKFVTDVDPEFIWAKPPSFDITLLEYAYAAVNIPVPWQHRQPRDCRTLFHLTGAVQPEFGTAHHALDDAISQAGGVIDAFRRHSSLQPAA
ncbi:MAG: 3'-5' exoribonuclease [Devosia sp.]|nr:3'-5' exoribonuclease [Devosia sp.]